MSTHHQVLIIGGGTAGIMVAAQLIEQQKLTQVAIIEPAETHYYQPAWTLVGAGTYDFAKTARPMASVMPAQATWIKDRATGFDPANNSVHTATSGTFTYDYLVVAPGLAYDMSLVPGLGEALGKGVVCSNYTDARHTWEVVKNFKGGTALFTQPTTPIKCGGAPQKTMYLSDSYWRKNGVREKSEVVFATAGTVIFGVPEIKKTLMEVVDRKDLNLRFGYQLKKIDGPNRIAWYALADFAAEHNHKNVKTERDGDLTGIHFDMLHTAPPSVAPKFVQDSPLVNAAGWLDVDHHSMQHKRYPNIFGLGDVAALPTAKTGAAIRKQVPIVVDNLALLIKTGKLGTMSYNGYSSCPLVTDYGKMVLAEFDYDNKFIPDPKLKQLLIKDSSKEHWRLWMLKKYMLPYLYWNKMMKGQDV
ncbi:FAD/NAD(P)-binding oxidoreductase [Neolewinella lacunae]|uniref:NAD(P)/FAD-dependent oxidoreductase n=1 Tax=Neolewinella lacunae TaxID=1517758 RepID=A0A923TBS7_9BACT|nr:FAD/NAD(P)-binding oxidoreductase [Neolewinella lacunae]MBC6992937.1 NAD(P)/FAD-dependent oxidoreductase [Neolewinella lacunae]MDN3633699.1 FAD/NAD(P)-binding oxidoreductase [Neolewinella lacunae]